MLQVSNKKYHLKRKFFDILYSHMVITCRFEIQIFLGDDYVQVVYNV